MISILNNQNNNGINRVKEGIIQNLDHPKQLELLYRKDKALFQSAFYEVYPEIMESRTAQIWNERLSYQQAEISWGGKNEFLIVAIASFIAGCIAKFPQWTNLKEDFFFQRNIGFVIFPMLMFYFSWKQKLPIRKLFLPVLSVLFSAFFINYLPDNEKSNSILLACIHLPIFLWVILGYTFVGGDLMGSEKKINYLRYNGDFVVITAVIMLSGFLFSAITIGLFKLIGLNIENFYAQNVAIWGAAAIPVVSTYLVQNNPHLVNKISPVIAKIFTPIVFFTLLIFLSAIAYTGKNIYDDRNFLLIFNAMLIGVMAIILFSLSEVTKSKSSKIQLLFLFGLSLLTIIANGLALSAIVFRLTEFGITPNRIAVLGANLLIFINLILVAHKLYLIARGKATVQKAEAVIALFIPIYGIWAALVTLGLPLLFNFK